MSRFLFYLEYDGKRTLSNTYETPVDEVHADGVLSAISLFAAKNGLKKEENESLENGNFRVFYIKKGLFGRSKEVVYFVKQDDSEFDS
ncbi:hypothetical protein [Sporolactobacillus laevolacticus]|uniref:hypothetical protein n=1 Tax=Sporolactobacillus laevolacticus TaxID=33018 RepID=UPI0025B55881|nr:hypothetical protein [Sporolactobacillus laevolacticus]MDN3954734.1 hypothetical protein [Sporolactobacillus laevolacticus]